MDAIKITLLVFACLLGVFPITANSTKVEKWHKIELRFESNETYDNPLYDVEFFGAEFTSPTGEKHIVRGFWDGDNKWEIRFRPNKTGNWRYKTICSDPSNKGLDKIEGKFRCARNRSKQTIYRKGSIFHPKGEYHLAHANGDPFLYIGCTAWNGGLFSTPGEWEDYLSNRKETGYSVIQLVTTQWRGGPSNAEGELAFTGNEKIEINPSFFQRMDARIDRINDYGLVAAPIMLWAYGNSNPGSYLPETSVIKLAEYILARYDANHIIWNLGGDGKYTDENENRWKNIGRQVFGNNGHGNVVTLHPRGFSWYGNAFNDEPWLDMISYQTGHANSDNVIRWKAEGSVASSWKELAPRPIIDTEPVYDNGFNAQDVRLSAYLSIFSAPVAGITYGSHTIWPWLRVGDTPINHGVKPPSEISWQNALFHDGSKQIGYLSTFFNKLEWWKLFPSNELLSKQPGASDKFQWQSVLADSDRKTILVYVPTPAASVRLHGIDGRQYNARWFDTALNRYLNAEVVIENDELTMQNPCTSDAVLILRKR